MFAPTAPAAPPRRAAALCALLLAALGAASCVDTDASTPDASPYPADFAWERLTVPDGWITSDGTCAYFSTEAARIPSALLIVLDRSSSMGSGGKWSAARQAIIQAIDQQAFDKVALGLLAYPAFGVPGPPCLFGLVPKVSCGVSAAPQVPLADSGTEKSTAASGVRRNIADWLAGATPDTTNTDASPGYEALQAAITALQAHPVQGKRLLLFISDGGFSCASVSKPTRPGYSDGLCPDWEHPATVITLLKAAAGHATKPVSTFVVGVPGSDSTGKPQGAWATAPYHMRLALSAYAAAGSPDTVPKNCTGKTFSQVGADPTVPCHFDMTSGTFDAAALAGIIDTIRSQAVGCTYALPKVDDKNKVIDKNRVNVRVTIDGGPTTLIPRRSRQSDTCSQTGCWDYDAATQIRLLGKACLEITKAKQAKVEINVGCSTVLK